MLRAVAVVKDSRGKARHTAAIRAIGSSQTIMFNRLPEVIAAHEEI